MTAPDPSDETAARSPGESRAVRALVAVLAFYRRWISPMFPPACRFHPSCSAYAIGALRVHGVLVGTGLTLVRVAKCAPWHPGGLDPVPPRRPGAGVPITEEYAS